MRIRTLSLALLATLMGCRGTPESSAAQASAPEASSVNPSSTVTASRITAITRASAKVAPAVVTVQTEVVQRVASDPFEAFFGGRSGTQSQAGLGTGFIIRSDGVIVTNAHVVAGASTVSVMMRDGTVFPAKVLGADETIDLAVLRIESKNLPVVTLGNSDGVVVGEWAIAIGNPYGFMLGNPEPSVTAGVISGVGRNLVSGADGPQAYFDMIQTDAAINPGNSGGPLVNADGEVIGVNSSIYSTSGGSVGLGFAIPINRARRVADDLLEHGAVRRPWVGLKLEARRSDNPRDAIARGAVVAQVVPGSPAARAGMSAGDVITSVNGHAVHNSFDWEGKLLDLRVGETAALVVRRSGRDTPLRVAIADLPDVSAPKVAVLKEVELTTLSQAIRAERGVRSASGAYVFRISDRMQQELSLQPGDVIVQVNRTSVASAEDVARAIDYYAARGPVTFFFERNGQIFRTDVYLK
ncbi:MAG: putative family peptidase [Gemmatimonadetes bacterium]|nr:putative family peptidase [Gemmatimonadota bacterium]